MDLGFPIIEFSPQQSTRAWGEMHGEQFREAIKELAEVRLGLINYHFPDFDRSQGELFSRLQFEATKFYSPELYLELRGIMRGAGISLLELVVLNNYTDFRDLLIPEQGCSTLALKREGRTLAGFTWDMHGSAQEYAAVLKIPVGDKFSYVFTVAGCVGMAGFSAHRTMCAINNLYTWKAEPSVMWPVVVRSFLQSENLAEMKQVLAKVGIGSGRNYLIADKKGAAMYEVCPGKKELVNDLTKSEEVFHTNHCITEAVKAQEITEKLSTTTHARYELLEELAPKAKSLDELKQLLASHQGYPKSICVHASASSFDPSKTCAAACGDLESGEVLAWRGCDKIDLKKVEHKFKL